MAVARLYEEANDKADAIKTLQFLVREYPSTPFKDTDTGRALMTALRLAVRADDFVALRTLFADRPHLIPDKDRGMRLILGTADP